MMATGDEEGRVCLWDNCNLFRILRGHAPYPIKSISYFDNGDDDPDQILRLITGCKKGKMIIWNPHLGTALHSIDTIQNGIGCIRAIKYTYPRLAKFVYVSGEDCSIKLFDIEKGRPLSILLPGLVSACNCHTSKDFIVFNMKPLDTVDRKSSSMRGNLIVTALNPHIGIQTVDIDPVIQHWLAD
jgi:WD40 repeat protein